MRCKQPLLLLSLLISITGFAQEKFIEVTVSDTVWVKPNQFVYSITGSPTFGEEGIYNGGGSSFRPYQKKQSEIANNKKQLLDSIRTVVVKKGFYVLPTDIHYAYNTDDKSMENTLNILTSSVDSVQLLYSIVNNNASLIGNLSTVFSDKEDEYASFLLKKLMAKASAKAAEIAGFSNTKIGNIVSVKEEANYLKSGGWTAYPPLSSLSNRLRLQLQELYMPVKRSKSSLTLTDLYKLENALVVRFAVQ